MTELHGRIACVVHERDYNSLYYACMDCPIKNNVRDVLRAQLLFVVLSFVKTLDPASKKYY